jgi:hypothetical protein
VVKKEERDDNALHVPFGIKISMVIMSLLPLLLNDPNKIHEVLPVHSPII